MKIYHTRARLRLRGIGGIRRGRWHLRLPKTALQLQLPWVDEAYVPAGKPGAPHTKGRRAQVRQRVLCSGRADERMDKFVVSLFERHSLDRLLTVPTLRGSRTTSTCVLGARLVAHGVFKETVSARKLLFCTEKFRVCLHCKVRMQQSHVPRAHTATDLLHALTHSLKASLVRDSLTNTLSRGLDHQAKKKKSERSNPQTVATTVQLTRSDQTNSPTPLLLRSSGVIQREWRIGFGFLQ